MNAPPKHRRRMRNSEIAGSGATAVNRIDLHRLLLPLQPGDTTPPGLNVHGQHIWTVVQRDEHPSILVLWLEDREAPQHMFFGYPKCWIATNTSKTLLSNVYAEFGVDGPRGACDLAQQQRGTECTTT